MLHDLSQAAIALHGTNTSKIIDHIVTNLTETYGKNHINPRQDEWFFNNAGGAMGERDRILLASPFSLCSFSFPV
jgi:C-8 sterol isomerase